MRSDRRRLRIAAVPIALAMLGCGAADDDVRHAHPPAALSDQEDAVCGMLVREQSAPRGQVVHRDGSRFFFCSIGDLLVHLSAPSPHGRADDVFVEVMDPSEDPGRAHTGEHAWLPVDEAVYVVGIDRPGIMGAPVLTYATRQAAEQVASKYPGARVLDAAALREWWKASQRGH